MWALRSHPSYGKGFAVRTGMLAATGELLAFTDADGTYGQHVVQALAEVRFTPRPALAAGSGSWPTAAACSARSGRSAATLILTTAPGSARFGHSSCDDRQFSAGGSAGK